MLYVYIICSENLKLYYGFKSISIYRVLFFETIKPTHINRRNANVLLFFITVILINPNIFKHILLIPTSVIIIYKLKRSA